MEKTKTCKYDFTATVDISAIVRRLVAKISESNMTVTDWEYDGDYWTLSGTGLVQYERYGQNVIVRRGMIDEEYVENCVLEVLHETLAIDCKAQIENESVYDFED